MNLPDVFLQIVELTALAANDSCYLIGMGLMANLRGKSTQEEENTVLVQEGPGFHLGISQGVQATGQQAAKTTLECYQAWLESNDSAATDFKDNHFSIAVGGGNTVINHFNALISNHFQDFNWIDHVRFFVIEETCNVQNRTGTYDSLVSALIEPLAKKLIAGNGINALKKQLDLPGKTGRSQLIKHIVDLMVFPIDLSGVEHALRQGDQALALKEAEAEASHYETLLKHKLGPKLACHFIISGVGRDGSIGAFEPYTPELARQKPGVIAIKKGNNGISVALNRGALIAADCISLIIAGNQKLRALGRFEMEDSAPLEQSIQETPIRMLRENPAIAEKVYVFADDAALYFEEGVFRFTEEGRQHEIKSELRRGDEEDGVHMLLMHGFMGLYSFINLLIGLPGAWTVSALRRGKHAKSLADDEVFPHYANTLRKIILRESRQQRPTPFCCHSMGGIISDQLLLSLLPDNDANIPAINELNQGDRQLVEAMRTSGMIEIATWAPSDIIHLMQNIEKIRAYRKDNSIGLDLTGHPEVYDISPAGELKLNSEHAELYTAPALVTKLLKMPGIETIVNGLNVAVRYIAKKGNVSKRAKKDNVPYGKRLLGDRVLKKVSFYGVLKELLASVHDPDKLHQQHLKALDVLIEYDIPYLAIIHEDDFLVSANRHIQEHAYLLNARLKKEGAQHESDLKVQTRLMVLKSEDGSPPEDLVDPHFLILASSDEGSANARAVTAEITRFVNSNIARAIDAGRTPPLDSVRKWLADNESA